MINFGEIYGGPEPAYRTTDGVEIWMWRKGQKVRFFDAEGNQHGPEHKNVAPAVYWAAYNGWMIPDHPFLSLAMTDEVRSKSTFRGEDNEC